MRYKVLVDLRLSRVNRSTVGVATGRMRYTRQVLFQ